MRSVCQERAQSRAKNLYKRRAFGFRIPYAPPKRGFYSEKPSRKSLAILRRIARKTLRLMTFGSSSSYFFHFIKLFRRKPHLGNRNVFLWEAEIGKFVIPDPNHVADLVPIIVGI